jgi:signal recognition particle subunit SRP54
VIIIDTAGRLAVDEAMMKEVADIKSAVNPAEILFVVDSMTGTGCSEYCQGVQ